MLGSIGSIIGGALGIASNIWGGWKASEAAKKAKENNERMQRENQNWYDRRYNEDPTQRADAQRILTMTAERIRERNKAAEGRAAVAGGIEESVAATKEANAKALADAASEIAARGEARKDSIEQRYMANKQGLVNQASAIEQNRANNIAKATQGAGVAAMKAGIAADSLLGGQETPETTAGNGTGQVAGGVLTNGIDDLKKDDEYANYYNFV